MKRFSHIILYLNIYIAFTSVAIGQQLSLQVEAEKPIPESLLDSLGFQSEFSDYTSLKKQTDTLGYQFERLGFIESKLELLRKDTDTSYTGVFYLGPRFRQMHVFYSGEDFQQDDLERISDEVKDDYFVLPFLSIEPSLQKLNALISEEGNAFARLRLRNVTKVDSTTLRAQLELEAGTVRRVDSIVIRGYEKFPRSYLKYYAGVKQGQPFNREQLIEQNDILNGLGFATSSKTPEALFRKDSTTVYFYLNKNPNNLFDGILGFATNEETNNIEFNGYLNLELNNNLNFGEQLLLNYKADGNEQQNFRVRTSLPYLFRSPFGVQLELKIFKRDSSFVTTEQQARVSYQINPSSTAYLGYKGNESSNLLNEVLAGSAIEDYTSRFAVGGITYQKPQANPLFPIKTFVDLSGELGSRESDGVSEDQFRVATTAFHIFNLNPRNSIFLQNDTGYLSSDTYLVNELFRFGGINSIRGFNENSIDASLYSVLNTEYRYQFGEGLYLHSIIDLGYFENPTLSRKEKLYSFGLGVGLRTQAGVFKINIANGNSENQNFNFSNTKIHLSLSSRF